MSKLNFTVDTDDMFDCEEGIPFEKLFTDSFKREILNDASKKLGSEQFKNFSKLTEDTIVSDLKLRMQGFLDEDIALTDTWGKATFVGSVEDLIKSKFDDILLRPVNSQGETLKACSSGNLTWIEWKINDKLKNSLDDAINNAKRSIEKHIKQVIDEKLTEITSDAVKKKIGNALSNVLYQEEK